MKRVEDGDGMFFHYVDWHLEDYTALYLRR
jgi:hypothetical protein